MMLAIRVLRDGLVIREQIFKTLPIRIGRDPGCDLILTDPSVSRDHAQVRADEDGRLVIVDDSGTNGLYAGPKRVASERIEGRLRARLGVVELEIEEVSASATQPISLEDLHRLDQRRTPLTWVKYIVMTLAAINVDAVLSPEFWSPWNAGAAIGLVWQSGAAIVAVLVFGAILLGLLKAVGRKVRFADVLHHFAVYSWLHPLAVVMAMLGYYLFADGTAGLLHAWLPTLATVIFLTKAAAIRRPGSNRGFLIGWAAAFLLIEIGTDLTGSYAARQMGQPSADHSMLMPAPVLGAGPSAPWDEYAKDVEAAGARSEAEVRSPGP